MNCILSFTFQTTETVKYWVKTDFYCYKTDKLIIPIKKFKECESSSGYDRHKRSVIIDDRIEQSESVEILGRAVGCVRNVDA